MKTYEKINLLNEYYDAVNYNDNTIYLFDDYTINELFSNPWDALRAAHFGDVNFTHEYFHFNGYGNLETLSNWEIDELFEDSDFQEWAIENDYLESDEEEEESDFENYSVNTYEEAESFMTDSDSVSMEDFKKFQILGQTDEAIEFAHSLGFDIED